MWLFTRAGFFSAVDKDRTSDGEGEVCVRARVREDFLRLRDLYFPDMPEIVVEEHSDYPYRIFVNKRNWASIVEAMSLDIDYSNFKGIVSVEQGADRSHLYGEVWAVMYGAEQKLQKNRLPHFRRHAT